MRMGKPSDQQESRLYTLATAVILYDKAGHLSSPLSLVVPAAWPPVSLRRLDLPRRRLHFAPPSAPATAAAATAASGGPSGGAAGSAAL